MSMAVWNRAATVNTIEWDTALAYVRHRKHWRLQVTHRPTGRTTETYYKRYQDAVRARITLTPGGTRPAGTNS